MNKLMMLILTLLYGYLPKVYADITIKNSTDDTKIRITIDAYGDGEYLEQHADYFSKYGVFSMEKGESKTIPLLAHTDISIGYPFQVGIRAILQHEPIVDETTYEATGSKDKGYTVDKS